MNTYTLRNVAMLSLLLILTVGSVVAQSPCITSNIPFSFTVDDKIFPAGQYNVERRTSDNVWLVKSRDGRVSIVFHTNEVRVLETQEKSKLLFRRYGNQYFLSQIWTAGTSSG